MHGRLSSVALELDGDEFEKRFLIQGDNLRVILIQLELVQAQEQSNYKLTLEMFHSTPRGKLPEELQNFMVDYNFQALDLSHD